MTLWLNMIAAAYRVDIDDAAWLDGVVDVVRPKLDDGLGVYAFFYQAPSPSQYSQSAIRFYGCSPEVESFAVRAGELTTPEIVRDILLSHPFGTTSDALGRRRLSTELSSMAPPHGIADSVGLNAIDPLGNGCIITGPRRTMARLGRGERSLFRMVTAHLAAGHRLRRGLARTLQAQIDSAEAIIEPGGAVQHAVGAAEPAGARAALVRATARLDRARRRETDSRNAVELWTALVSGRWSIVDRFDTDGRRFFLAWRNDPAVPTSRELTPRELQVASYAALGHSNKLIAYSLGLSESTVATHLTTARTKLGLRTRLELIELVRAIRWRDVAG